MANTTLRAYLDDLNLLLNQEALEEVIGHCRHILQHFPKNVETYRILGKALLERGRHQEAGDVFQRVLSAIPDDFTAHLGLSSAWEEQGQVDAAIMHLERAFEQEPNNGALQSELKRLYERRGGAIPERIQYTRGALARMYLKGKLYTQATGELEMALAQTPDRADLQVLLVEALRQTDHLVEASEVALHVMDTLPDSIEANRTLATLWLRSARPSDAKPFVIRLEQLDPFVAWHVVHPDGKELPKNAFQVPRLIWNARTAAALATDVPDWVSSIGDVFESPESVSLSSAATDWLDKALAKPATPSGRIPPSQSGLLKVTGNLGTPVFQNQDEIPDWFKDVAAGANPSTPAATQATAADIPDWLESELQSNQSAPLADAGMAAIPDWLDDTTDVSNDLGNAPFETTQPASNALPEWLADEDSSAQPGALESAEAEPLNALEWLNTGSLPTLDETNAEPSGMAEFNWTADEPDNFAALFDPQMGDAPAGGSTSAAVAGIDWLDTDTAADGVADDDPLAWMSRAGLTPLATSSLDMPATTNEGTVSEETAEIDHTDDDPLAWMIQAGLTPPKAPTGSLEPLDESFGSLFNEPEQTPPVTIADSSAQQSDDPFAWMIEAGLTPPKTPTGGLQWLDDPDPNLAPETGLPSTVEKPPSQTIAPAWLSSMAAADAPTDVHNDAPLTSTDEPEPLSLDWLSVAPTATHDVAALESASDDGLDWLSDMREEGLTASAPTESAEPLSVDWLKNDAANRAGESAIPVVPAAENDDLDWLSGMSETPPETVNQTVAEAEQDPIAWMQQFGMAPLAVEERPAPSSFDQTAAENVAHAEMSDLDLGSLKELLGDDADFSFDAFDSNLENVDSVALDANRQPDTALEADTLAPAALPDWMGTLAPPQPAAAPTTAPPTALIDPNALDFDQLAQLESSDISADNVDWLATPPSSTRLLSTALDAMPETATPESVLPESGDVFEDEWLTSFEAQAAPTTEPPSLVGLTDQPAAAQNTDWLASFESPVTTDSLKESLLSQDTKPPTAKTDWLGSLAAAQPDQMAEPDWLTPAADSTIDEDPWLSLETLEPSESTVADSLPIDEDMPAWMRDSAPIAAAAGDSPDEWLTPEAKNQFDDLLKRTAEKANQPREVSNTGVLDQGKLPDWLSAFAEEAPVLDEHPLADAASDIQPGTPELTQHESAPLEDFGVADVAPIPDWLAAMSLEASTSAGSLIPDASAEQQPLEALDFDSLLATDSVSDAQSFGDLDFSSLNNPDEPSHVADLPTTAPLNEPVPAENVPTDLPLAQPADVVDTSKPSPTSAGSFKFERKPAWMSKKKNQAPAPTEPPVTQQASDDPADLSNLLDNLSESSNDADLPDWLNQ